MRHAKSAWPEETADYERPLAARGGRDAPVTGQWLRDHVAGIDLVVCSPASRARQTWELVAPQLCPLPEVRYDERVYGASIETLLGVIRELPQHTPTVLVVGHNPGLEELVELLTGAVEPLKTSAIAVLAGPADWPDVAPRSFTLADRGTPRA